MSGTQTKQPPAPPAPAPAPVAAQEDAAASLRVQLAAAQAALDAERAAHAATFEELAAAHAPPAPPPAPEPAPEPTGTLTVGLKGISGLVINLAGQRVTLAGTGAAVHVGPYGSTPGIPAAAFEAWLVEHADDAVVKSSSLIVLSRQP